jgi:hypothetical protein
MMIRLARLLTAATLVGGWIFGQEKPAAASPNAMEAEIISVKTLSGDSFNRLANMLKVFEVRYVADERLRTILVYAPKDVVAQMRSVVERLDRPGSEAAIGRNIDMTMTFLLCSSKAPADSRPLSAEMEPVARQLRAISLCKDVSALDTVPLRIQEGKETQQTSQVQGLPTNVPGQRATLQLILNPEAILQKGTERFVRFRRVDVNFRIPYLTGPDTMTQFQFRSVGVNTAGDFKEGQMTVLGKLSGIDDDNSLFIVVSLKVLD